LLAVPVFYSLFDDVTQWRIFSRMSDFSSKIFGGVRRKFATATSSIFNKQ